MISKLKITIKNLLNDAELEELGRQRFWIELEGELDEELLRKLVEFLKKEAPEILPKDI